MAISTISTHTSIGIRLGTANYAADLTVTNTGVVNSPSFGVYSNLTDTTLVNDGSIHAGVAVTFAAGSTGSNIVNSGSIYGVTIAVGMRASDTLTNYGAISSGITYAVGVQGNSSLKNEGTISSGTLGVILTSGSMLNSGRIDAGVDGFAMLGGSATNAGIIYGNKSGIAIDGGGYFFNNAHGYITSKYIGASVLDDTSEPYGLISAGTIEGTLAGLLLQNAAVKNTGTLLGNTVGAALYLNSTFDNAGIVNGSTYGVYFEDAVLTNLGTITGGRYAVDGYGAFTLNVYAGSVFNGKVLDQAGTGALSLLGAGTENTLSGIGTQFTGFDDFNFTSRSFWTLEGNTAGLADTQTITGFRGGDALVLDSFAATSETFVSGVGIILGNGFSTETLAVSSLSPNVSLTLSTAADNSTITAAISTISTYISTYGITLGANGYATNLTITNTGTVEHPPNHRNLGYYPASFTITSGTKNADIDNYGHIGGVDAKSSVVIENHNTIDSAGVSLGAGGTIINSGVIVGTGSGIYLAAGGTIFNSGTVIDSHGPDLYGRTPAIYGNGRISLIVDSGAVFKGSVIDSSGNGQLILGGTSTGSLNLDAMGLFGTRNTFSGFSEITFATGSNWLLEGNTSQLAAGETITGFGAGDSIFLDDFTATSKTYVPNVGLVLGNGTITETLNLIGTYSSDQYLITDEGDGTEITAPCFAAGTRIATLSGNRPVETLKIGDLVRTQHNGLRPIKWIGSRRYEGTFCTGKHLLLPIRIRRHAIGFNIPSRDLIVSPDHAIRIRNALIPAWRLLNGVSITQATYVDSISYFHIELESHDILLAENCPAESFLDTACRHRFHNAADYKRLYPAFSKLRPPCLPRLEHGFALREIQQQLAARAGIKPTPVAQGRLRGVIDEMGRNLMRGWAQDAAAPEQPVLLILTQHGQPIARLLANRYRPDLRAAGLGSGCHAFEMALPESPHGSLELRRATDGALLATEIAS